MLRFLMIMACLWQGEHWAVAIRHTMVSHMRSTAPLQLYFYVATPMLYSAPVNAIVVWLAQVVVLAFMFPWAVLSGLDLLVDIGIHSVLTVVAVGISGVLEVRMQRGFLSTIHDGTSPCRTASTVGHTGKGS